MPTAATAAKAAAAVVVGPGVAASDAILRGQLAQLRRQVRLQWCAVDASSAVTQEVRARQFCGVYPGAANVVAVPVIASGLVAARGSPGIEKKARHAA